MKIRDLIGILRAFDPDQFVAVMERRSSRYTLRGQVTPAHTGDGMLALIEPAPKPRKRKPTQPPAGDGTGGGR